MEVDLLFSSGNVAPIGALAFALLFTIRHHNNSGDGTAGTIALVFTDPIFFLQVCAGLIRQLKYSSNEELLLIGDTTHVSPITPTILDVAPKPSVSIDRVSSHDQEHDDFLSAVRSGLFVHPPELCPEGTNGTYFLRDMDGNTIAVFKPNDEEGDSPQNPREQPRSSHERGVLSGEAAVREVIASRLDQRLGGIFRVPTTVMVSVRHPVFTDAHGQPKSKLGSLQRFVDNDGPACDIGPRSFPVREVHNIAALDMMIHNTDRHDGNILYKKEGANLNLTPIDHGFSLPDKFGTAWWDWTTYPQSDTPFGEELVESISRFDAQEFINEISTEFHIREECARVFKVSCFVLRTGMAAGKTPKQLAAFMSRRNPNEISPVETLVSRVEQMDGNLMENMYSEIVQAVHEL